MADYRAIFEKIPDGVTLHDPSDGSILAVNQQFCEMLGYSREELQAMDFEAIHLGDPPYTAEQAKEYIDKAASEGPQTFEWRDETKNGETLPVEVHLRQTTINGDERILAVVRDITERKQRERRLQRETERFRTLFDNTNDAVAWVEYIGETPYIREANPRFRQLFEPPEKDVIDRPLDEVVTDEQRREEAKEISKRVKSGSQLEQELVRETVDGPRSFLWEAVPMEDSASGAVSHAFAVYTDISELRKRERELERYERIVEATGDPVYMLDEDGYITYVNEAVLDFSGYSEEELLGAHAGKVMKEEHLERGNDLIRSLLSSERNRGTFELDFITADGDRIPCENHVALLPFDEEFRGTVGVLRDISERVERERRLKRERDRFEEFASVLSHDLRNPLNVATGRLELAQEDCESEHLDAVEEAQHRMESLIDDMLSLASAGQSVGETEAVELGPLAKECWQHVETTTAELTIETDLTIEADESRVQQLLENLLRNAVEHGPDGVKVTIGELSNGFYVEDDGPGIPPDERDDVFSPGYSSTEEGTGFGLNIVREIAEAHGWNVTLTESAAGGGARFEFTGVETG